MIESASPLIREENTRAKLHRVPSQGGDDAISFRMAREHLLSFQRKNFRRTDYNVIMGLSHGAWFQPTAMTGLWVHSRCEAALIRAIQFGRLTGR